MPEVWQMTRSEFVGDWPTDDTEAQDLDLTFGYECDHLTSNWMPRTLRPVHGHPGFFFADIAGQPYDVALVQQDRHDGSYDVVGYYCDGHRWDESDSGQVWVDEGVRRRERGLGAALILEKAEQIGGAICCMSYTSAGKRAHEAAHKLAVRRAVEADQPVPGDVLADYPEFERALSFSM